jgi:threonine synthase
LKSEPIKYYSTNRKSGVFSFREALLKGLAPDGGLFMPDRLPELSTEELNSFCTMAYSEIARFIIERFTGNDPDSSVLEKICRDAYNFDVPLEQVTDRRYILRLDRGPTASFKDFAARMMSRLMQNYLASENRSLTILTATSGDTGSAVASAFHRMPDINVIILYPEREVTEMQRKQMTTLHENITVIAVDGKFDDCQDMVKKAFRDQELSRLPLSSANSINIGRLIPQSVYYIYAWSRVAASPGDKAVFSVPSGNFGNLTAGIIAARMGLPVAKFVISTNSNDEVPEFLRTGKYIPVVPSLNCISSAMNVGHPSNLARIVDLYGGRMDEKGAIVQQPDIQGMREDFFGAGVSDEDTRATIASVYKNYGNILEPHGAAAWHGMDEYLTGDAPVENQFHISLETAHPAKFPEEIRRITGMDPELPQQLAILQGKDERFYKIKNDYTLLKEIIFRHSK